MESSDVSEDEDPNEPLSREQLENNTIKSYGISAAELDELVHAFKLFDRDSNGHVNTREIEQLLLEYGQRFSDRDLECVFRRLTHGHSTKLITKTHFCLMLHNEMRIDDRPLETYIQSVLKSSSEDGNLSPEGLADCATKMGEKLTKKEAIGMLEHMNHPEEVIKLCSLKGKKGYIHLPEGAEISALQPNTQNVAKPIPDKKDVSDEKSRDSKHSERKENPSTSESKVKKEKKLRVCDDPRYVKYFRLIELGLDREKVKRKVAAEELDLIPALLDTPNAPPPP
eukprot:g841.t1